MASNDTPPPAAPSDREAALLAENEMLREAAGAYFIRSLVGGRLPADVAAGRQARRALADILARPPGAAGQALLDAADRLAEDAQAVLDSGGPIASGDLVRVDVVMVASNAMGRMLDTWSRYRQARSGAPGAAAPGGQPSGEEV